VLLPLAIAVLAAACAGPSPSPSPSTAPAGSPASLSASPQTPEPSASPTADLPSASTIEPSPTPSPSASPSTPARPTPEDNAAKACTGSAKTRDFFTAIAEAVAWPVYCAVLPAGWFVETGEYRLANGGQMVISYRTNAGGHLELREGRWCTDSEPACSPHDSVIGPASFGGLTGQLTTSGGELVLYVDPGEPASWTATGVGVDEATFRSICSRLALVGA
jgi:hypothetical protein